MNFKPIFCSAEWQSFSNHHHPNAWNESAQTNQANNLIGLRVSAVRVSVLKIRIVQMKWNNQMSLCVEWKIMWNYLRIFW